MNKDVERILYSKEDLHAAVEKAGRQITEDYRGKSPLLVGILKGSVVFMADLMREIDLPCDIDFMVAKSYGNAAVSSGNVRILKDLDTDINGRDIILVEDILDSGKTLYYISQVLKTRNPASIRICTLLDKPERREADIKADYYGTFVPDEFVVGYGLDFAEKYRNLPYIGVLKPEIYAD